MTFAAPARAMDKWYRQDSLSWFFFYITYFVLDAILTSFALVLGVLGRYSIHKFVPMRIFLAFRQSFRKRIKGM